MQLRGTGKQRQGEKQAGKKLGRNIPRQRKAAGAFVQGSSIELSADGPIRPPYAVYFQGGLTWYHAKLGILLSLQNMADAGLATLPEVQ